MQTKDTLHVYNQKNNPSGDSNILFLAFFKANNYNVQITADGVGEKAIDTMNLQLIKTTPGNQAIATFKGHASL